MNRFPLCLACSLIALMHLAAPKPCRAAASYSYKDLGPANGFLTFSTNGLVNPTPIVPGDLIRTYPGAFSISVEYGDTLPRDVPRAVAVFGDGARTMVAPTQAYQYQASYLFSVNRSGTFVGTEANPATSYPLPLGQAISFPGTNGGAQIVPTPNQGPSAALSINNAGMIVGQSGNIAFLSDGKSAWDLNTLIGPNNGFLLNTATDINDLGQILVEGVNSANTSQHYFLLTPTATPEPSTLALLSVGGLVYLARRRLGRSVSRV